jgi:hypothetical protein
MNSCVPDESTLQRLIAEIDASTPRPHHATLLAAAARLIPDCPWRFALTRGGWYRVGGVIGTDGARLADNLEDWVNAAMAACDDDLGEFLERHASALLVTRHAGKSHYFVARYGPEPADFLQLEVEELQEILDRRLWDEAAPPADAMELTDPIVAASVPAQPVAAPYYRFRRLTDMRRVAARLPAPVGKPSAIGRFMSEWRQSRAGEKAHLCEHWIVALREQHDRYNNTILSASPVSLHARQLKPFPWDARLKGLEAAAQLQAFDRAAGYPGAWYFHMIAGALVPRDVAYALMADIEAGFGYLAASDLALLKGWLADPYSV